MITFLRAVFFDKEDQNKVKICLQDSLCFPDIKKRSIIIRIDEDYTEAEIIQAEKSYRGFKEREEVSEFLSIVLQRDVLLIRSLPSRLMKID